ncbi:MAG: hypothetical protein L3J49_00585 [Desulfobulbaceae bacterium]|nr:hypothetical protein [Desulfobulbaceae bacterium]
MEQIVFQGKNNDHPLIVSDQYPLRSLRFTGKSRQSCINLQEPHILQLAYTRWMMSALLFSGLPNRILLLGLGGGALVHFLVHHHPHLQIDVVEKSKTVIELARNHFGIPDRKQLHIHHLDAESFCTTSMAAATRYNLILIDIFDADAMAPSMNQQNFYSDLCMLLTKKGVLAANLWGANKTEFTRARKAMQVGCNRHVLQLKVPEKGNIICLGFRQLITRQVLSQARNKIPASEQQYGLPFRRYWKRLLLDNPILFFRLLMP